MEQYIYDESNGLWYERDGDYYIPCLKLPETHIGIWGERYLTYIREHGRYNPSPLKTVRRTVFFTGCFDPAYHFQEKSTDHKSGLCFFGGDKRDRTADLLNAIQALSQLSYTPILSLAT